MNEYSHEQHHEDGIDLYETNPKLAIVLDKIIESEPDETNWRSLMHNIEPEMTGKNMLDSAESFIDVEERLLARNYMMEYRAEISRAVQRAVENGSLPKEKADAKVEEIFERPLIPEGQEIVL